MTNGGKRNGRLFTIVGASGSGKDSLLNGLATRLPALKIVQRYITRPQDGIGECHRPTSQRMFDRLARDDAFCSHGVRMVYLMEFQDLVLKI